MSLAIGDKSMNTLLRITLSTLLLSLGILSSAIAKNGACTVINGMPDYRSDFSADWTKEQNVAGTTYNISAPSSGESYKLECTCAAADGVNIYFGATTPLSSGHASGYYKLNDSLDISMQINEIPGGGTINVPSKVSSPVKSDGYFSANDSNSVCAAAAESAKAGAPTFSVGSSTTLTLYVTTPFLGELTIPYTHIATVQSGWSSSLAVPKNNFGDVAQIYLQGKITVPQYCVINQGDVIKVNLGFVDATRFTTKNQRPEGYSPVEFDIAYDCGDMSEIKNSLYMKIEGADVVDSYSLVARRRTSDNVPDVGIQMANITVSNNILSFTDGVITLGRSGIGSTRMHAFPVNLVGGRLQPGPFNGTATISVVIK